MIVVTAAIIERDGLFLISRRRKNDTLGGLWEFPGGRVERNETPDACMVRELREELGVEATPLALYDVAVRAGGKIALIFYMCSIVGDPLPLECDELCWVELENLPQYPFTPADVFIAERLSRQGLSKRL